MWSQQRRIQRLVRRLEIALPTPLTVHGLVSALEESRNRPIQFAAMTIDDQTPCGLWVATADTDYVLYNRNSSSVLKIQTILHELMHMGLRHTAGAAVPVAGQLMAVFGAVGAQTVLARSAATVSQQQEHEAELLATYLGARLECGEQTLSFDELGDDTAAVMYRIAETLAD
ncbi:hypothetical protein [Micromonospora profundi]|uniref:hypothetical protein n=1 Tax=Micromonospora profundi TaxID=1420889 RepID=UPI00366700FA